jgi:hypothetical protein
MIDRLLSNLFGGVLCGLCAGGLCLAMSVVGCAGPAGSGAPAAAAAKGGVVQLASQPASQPASAPAMVFPEGKFVSLFDGKSLAGWRVPKFGADGKVWVQDGQMHVGIGDGCTGATWTGSIMREDYELSLEARRVEGGDFFCGLTFPVGKEPVTLILGGWGGELVGLSCIDRYDASENATTTTIPFKNGQWYDVRVKVTKARVQCFLDDKEIVNVEREGRKFSIRWEVEESVPLGLATWKTHGALRNIRLRRLIDAEK